MTETPNLNLALIDQGAQKHLIANRAFSTLDALVMLAVSDRDALTAPSGPEEGDRYLVPAEGWVSHPGKAHRVAHFVENAWSFHVPKAGWLCFVVDENLLLAFDGADWRPATEIAGPLQNLARLGINTTADATNPLSAKLNNALFAALAEGEGGDGHLRYKLSKERADKTLSFLFQDNYSGRAEFGLAGDDDFHIKVSADGANWIEAMRVDAASGKVTLPAGAINLRERLTGDRTYHVAAGAGSDSNDGRSALAPFATIAHAIDVACDLDFNSHTVTISCADGAYPPLVMSRSWVGGGRLVLLGNPTHPENVTIIAASHAIILYAHLGSGVLRFDGFRFGTTFDGSAITLNGSGVVEIQNVDFGPTVWNHLYIANAFTHVQATGDYRITGNALNHINNTQGGSVMLNSRTVTLSGTLAFIDPFVAVGQCGRVSAAGTTFIGAATCARYAAFNNGVIFVNGVPGDIFPGNAPGYLFNGGQYL